MNVDLREGYRRGERSAIEAIYRQRVEEVERFVRVGLLRAHRLTAANLADVVQEVFLRVFSERARCGYDGARAFGPFLQTISRNALVDWLRRHERALPESDAAPVVEELLTLPDPLESRMFPADLITMTRDYIEALSPDLKAVHEQRFVADEAQEPAARALGISRQALRTLERRLLDGLRRTLKRSAEANNCFVSNSPLTPQACVPFASERTCGRFASER